MTILWKWNETDTTEFGAPILLLSQLTGTIQFERIAPFASSTIINPTLRINYGTFHLSGGLIGAAYSASAIIPINIPVDLPKRYVVCMTTTYISGNSNARFGFVFGASSGSTGVFGTVATNANFTLQSAGPRFRALVGNTMTAEKTGGGTNANLTSSYTTNRYTVQLNSLTGGVSGTVWRFQRTNATLNGISGPGSGYNWKKETIFNGDGFNSYGNWTTAPLLTKMYLFLQNPLTGGADPTRDYIDICNFWIEKHPQDE
jgi:hypothetical protein